MTNSLLRFSTFRAEAHVSPIRNTRAILFGDARCPPVISSITRSALSRQTSPFTSSEVFSLHLQESWLPEYTTELLNVLNVLTMLVELEPQQADLLDRICGGPLVSETELKTAGAFA